MVNETKGVSSSLAFTAPSGTKLDGNSVEWITERPGVNGGLATLADFTAAGWYYDFANTSGSVEYSPSNAPTGTLYNITMQDGGTNLSCGFASPDAQTNYTDGSGATYSLGGSALWFFYEATLPNCP
jgi:hypothetical protein